MISQLQSIIRASIPMVYDESLSYVEFLAAIQAKVNEIVNVMNEFFSEDLESAVSDILTEWTNDGTMTDLIADAVLKIGDLDDLDTTDKTDIVSAVNETVNEISSLATVLGNVSADLLTHGINAKHPPSGYAACEGDGVTDDTTALNKLLEDFNIVLLPVGEYRITDSIRLKDGNSLIGLSPTIREQADAVCLLKYDGTLNRLKAVIMVSRNEIGINPTVALSNVAVKNIQIDCNNLAGFGIYSTYLTNESILENITVWYSLEYNFYIARSWYSTYQRLYSMRCKNVGIALGMPLKLSDGSSYSWDLTPEMNGCTINNIRSHRAGEYYHTDHPATYDYTNAVMRYNGYGIGVGIGNGMFVDNFLSEISGGANLYVYTDSQPVKRISNGYMERAAEASGYAETDRPGIIIENTSAFGGRIELSDIFSNYNSNGGIYFIGDETKRTVMLKNIHQPRFLKSVDGLSDALLYSVVLKDNVYYDCGYTNSNIYYGLKVAEQEVNTGTSWSIPLEKSYQGGRIRIDIRSEDGLTPTGTIALIAQDGTPTYVNYPDLTQDVWVTSPILRNVPVSIERAGAGSDTAMVTFRIFAFPRQI